MAKKTAIAAAHIAIEGVIGVGKTTLAHALAAYMGAERFYESDIENPFLAKFYKHKERYALDCQLWFLQGRIQQCNRTIASGIPIVSDYSLIKERIFSQIHLHGDEATLYNHIYNLSVPHCQRSAPDIIIYLKASVEEIAARITQRGEPMESGIEWSYLHTLIAAYDDTFLENYPDTRQRILVVGIDCVNIAEDTNAIQRLVEACDTAPIGVSYYNPM